MQAVTATGQRLLQAASMRSRLSAGMSGASMPSSGNQCEARQDLCSASGTNAVTSRGALHAENQPVRLRAPARQAENRLWRQGSLAAQQPCVQRSRQAYRAAGMPAEPVPCRAAHQP